MSSDSEAEASSAGESRGSDGSGSAGREVPAARKRPREVDPALIAFLRNAGRRMGTGDAGGAAAGDAQAESSGPDDDDSAEDSEDGLDEEGEEDGIAEDGAEEVDVDKLPGASGGASFGLRVPAEVLTRPPPCRCAQRVRRPSSSPTRWPASLPRPRMRCALRWAQPVGAAWAHRRAQANPVLSGRKTKLMKMMDQAKSEDKTARVSLKQKREKRERFHKAPNVLDGPKERRLRKTATRGGAYPACWRPGRGGADALAVAALNPPSCPAPRQSSPCSTPSATIGAWRSRARS